MKVKIDHNLEEYMHKHHHDTISLKLVHDDLSIGDVNTKQPRINYKTPNHEEQFDKYIVDDITVYVSKNVECEKDTLEFVDEKLLGMHRCHVKGIKMDFLNKWK